jgi:hypothetical protein
VTYSKHFRRVTIYPVELFSDIREKYVKISTNGKKSAGCQRLLASRAFKIPILEVVVRLNFFS